MQAAGSERATRVAMLREQPGGLTWSRIAELVAARGGARAAWSHLFPDDLFGPTGPATAVDEASALLVEWESAGLRVLTFLDRDYPEQLREVRQMPPVVFAEGTLVPGERAVSVVGSREVDAAALDFAAETARLLVGRGVTVLSGLAAGIDRAAHLAALESGGRTVAVIGTGLRRYYPRDNRELQQEIARRGLVLSQFWPDSPPTKWSFPLRNATMSAYGQATVVVAAGEHSGTRIQAREAIAHGRPVVLAQRVVDGTRWGAELLKQPGVYRAASPAEALARLDDIAGINRRVADLLALAPA
jgi:DNA processing protein